MTRGFEQQDRSVNFTLPKSAPSPQHGQKGDPKAAAPTRPPRTFAAIAAATEIRGGSVIGTTRSPRPTSSSKRIVADT